MLKVCTKTPILVYLIRSLWTYEENIKAADYVLLFIFILLLSFLHFFLPSLPLCWSFLVILMKD